MSRTFFKALIAGAASIVLAQSANAATLTPAEVLQQFNVVVFGDVQAGSSVEGRTLIGGSLSGASADYQTRTTAPASSFQALTVGGNIEGSAKNINNGGSVVAGGNVANLNMNGGGNVTMGGVVTGTINPNGGVVTQSATVTIPDFRADLEALSNALAGLSGEAPQKTGNRGFFNIATPNADGLAVYATDAAFFDGIGELELGLNGASTVIVNVSGATVTISDNFLAGPFAVAPRVLWNFNEATSLTLTTQFFGSVLAPFADVHNTSAIEGTLIAKTFDQDAQIHLQPFIGDLPVSGVPLPPALAMVGFVAALGAGLGVARRRRSVAEAA